jgi:hypothetical protein
MREGYAAQVAAAQAAADAASHEAFFPARVEVGEQDGDGLADQPTAVGDETEPAQRQAGMFQIEQFGGGKVNGDLLIVLFPAGRLPFIGGDWIGGDGAQQFCYPGNAYPA